MLLSPFTRSGLVKRKTRSCGQGLFTLFPIPKGELILTLQGEILTTDQLQEHHRALQVGESTWLASSGENLDDYINHSCEPNAGFVTGELSLFALREIAEGEEITWDYSTSMNETGWQMECLCGSKQCRKIIRPWKELSPQDRNRLFGITLSYLRKSRMVPDPRFPS
jgi:SET domain-containing protein